MTMAIRRLHVRAKVPKRLRARAPDAARFARELLPRSVARHAGRLPSRPAVCRIRRLHVRLQLTARELDEGRLPEVWAEAFLRALLTAINQPPDNGNSVVAESTEAWLADLIRGALDGRSSAWMFEELSRYEGRPAADVVLLLVRDSDADWPVVLATLAASGQLDRVIYALGAAGCQELVQMLSRKGSGRTPDSLTDLINLAQLLRSRVVSPVVAFSDPLDSLVIRLVASLAADGDRRRYSPDALRSVVASLRWLGSRLSSQASAGPELDDLPLDDLMAAPALIAVVRSAVVSWRTTAGVPGADLVTLRDLVASLHDGGTSSRRTASARASAVAGLFLLVPVIERLDWPERIRRSAFGAEYGSRAVTYVLTGTALALLGQPATQISRLDPGVATFAGWGESFDPSAVAWMCRNQDAPACEALLRSILGESVDVNAVAGWDSAFGELGSYLVRRFAERLRGFSRSSERFVVSRMLAVPGAIAVDERRVLVRLQSNAFWPVVRLSGADEAVEAVSWLGGRRLEFEIEGV